MVVSKIKEAVKEALEEYRAEKRIRKAMEEAEVKERARRLERRLRKAGVEVNRQDIERYARSEIRAERRRKKLDQIRRSFEEAGSAGARFDVGFGPAHYSVSSGISGVGGVRGGVGSGKKKSRGKKKGKKRKEKRKGGKRKGKSK